MLAPLTASLGILLLYACGTFSSEPDTSDGGADGATASDSRDEPFIPDGAGPTDATDAGADAATDAAADADAALRSCSLSGGGSSSGSCTESYVCGADNVTITCGCADAGDGGCTCGMTRFAFAFTCGAACTITASERTKCGVSGM